MKTEKFYQDIVNTDDSRETGVMSGQKVNVAMNENDLWTAIDCCNYMLNNKDKIEGNIEIKIRSVISKLVEAGENLWEIKEIKTRRGSSFRSKGPILSEKKPNPILMHGEI